jgi:arylamine N-acetyltransferase
VQTEHPAPRLFERYLRALGVDARPPGLDALCELTAAHLHRVPFENLSKLLHRRDRRMRLPALDRFLDGIEAHGFGGTCYSNNYHLSLLLAHLGYDVRLCGADMSKPDMHVVNVVTLEGCEYLVDVGYGAPFDAPMPLGRAGDFLVALGDDRYVLKPRTPDGRTTLEQYRDGKLRHGYRINPRARRIEEFAGVIEASFAEQATFMNALVIVRFRTGASRDLHNLLLRECEGPRQRTRELPDAGALPAVIEEQFGIEAGIARRALDGVDLSRNVFD